MAAAAAASVSVVSLSRVEVRAKSYRTTKNLFTGKYIDLSTLKRSNDL